MEPATSCHASSPPSPSDEAKLFVGGILWKTTEHSLKEHFAKYGEVASASVVRNRDTSAGRVFAFVLFADPAAAKRALADTNDHVIMGKKVDVKKARTRCHGHPNHQHAHANQYQYQKNRELTNSIPNSHNGIPLNPRKIFVGGLSPSLTKDEFINYFEQFGTVKDVAMLYDFEGRSRGFGFVEFHSTDDVQKVVQNRFHRLKDRLVEVKIAVPQNANNNNKEIIHHSSDENMMIGGGGGGGGGGEGYVSDNYQAGFYPMHDPSNAGLQGYMPPLVLCYACGSSGFVGGYAARCYCCIGYNFVSADLLRSPLNSQESVPTWQSLMPYVSAIMYPGYDNAGFSGYMNFPNAGYNATMGYGYSSYGNWNQNLYDMQSWNVDDTEPQAPQ